MPKAHLINIHFEAPELYHPNFFQLEFLPMLYAEPSDILVVTHLPSDEYLSQFKNPPQVLLREKPLPRGCTELETWGPSKELKSYAEKNHLIYRIPSEPLIQMVSSKLFAFEHAPKLPGARALQSEEECLSFLSNAKSPQVLKTLYGFAGRGNFIVKPGSPIPGPIKREWEKGLPIIGEPWMERVIDFSTQWYLHEGGDIEYLGATVCKNNAIGIYQGNVAGREEVLFKDHMIHLETHLHEAKKLLQKASEKGFFGHVGIDAMIYHFPDYKNSFMLHPIVEMNPRKTMGWVALKLFTQSTSKTLEIHYAQGNRRGLLPTELYDKNHRQMVFRKQLYVMGDVNGLFKN